MLAKTVYYPATTIAAVLAAASYTIATPDTAVHAPAASAYHDDGHVHPVSALGGTAVKPEGLLHFIAS